MKKLSLKEISRLNQLLEESLQQATHDELACSVKLLATSLARLKMQYQVEEKQTVQGFKEFVDELKANRLSSDLSDLAAKTIVECATALAVSKENLGDNSESS